MNEEYILYLQTDFGELKVQFESEHMLTDQEVYKEAIKILNNSEDIILKSKPHFYDIAEGEVLD